MCATATLYPLTLRGCIYIAWLFFVPMVIKRNHMDLLHFGSEYSCLNWLLIRSRRRYLNKLLFQSRRSCLDWWLLHKLVGVPVHAQMSELAIDRVPTLLPDLTYAQVSAQLLKCNWQLFWSRIGVPAFTLATTHRTIFNWSLTSFKTAQNGTFLLNSSVDEPISFEMGPS